jgi:hypothetical protein
LFAIRSPFAFADDVGNIHCCLLLLLLLQFVLRGLSKGNNRTN